MRQIATVQVSVGREFKSRPELIFINRYRKAPEHETLRFGHSETGTDFNSLHR